MEGVAMGGKISATYAILTIGFLEQQLYQTLLPESTSNYVKKNLFRFIDDIFIIWNTELGDKHSLFDSLNNLNQISNSP